MIANILQNLSGFQPKPELMEDRSRLTRFAKIPCECIINGISYNVRDWSLSGIEIYTDKNFLSADTQVSITLRFSLHNTVTKIEQEASVIRKGTYSTALKFNESDPLVMNKLQSIVNECTCSEMLDSHINVN